MDIEARAEAQSDMLFDEFMNPLVTCDFCENYFRYNQLQEFDWPLKGLRYCEYCGPHCYEEKENT